MEANNKRIETASKLLGKAVQKIRATDPEMAARLSKLLADEMEAVRQGR